MFPVEVVYGLAVAVLSASVLVWPVVLLVALVVGVDSE